MGWGQEQEHPCGSSEYTTYFSGRWDVWEQGQGQGHHCGSSGCTASLRGGWTCVGTGLVPSTLQRICSGGTHCPARTACRQRSITATACVYRLPTTSAWLVAFGGQSPGRAGPGWELSRHGNLLNQLEVLPAGGWHITHTCQGSSATGLPCYGAHTAPAVRLLFLILAQLCDSLGSAPQSLAACFDHVPLGKEYPGQMTEVALRLALPTSP